MVKDMVVTILFTILFKAKFQSEKNSCPKAAMTYSYVAYPSLWLYRDLESVPVQKFLSLGLIPVLLLIIKN